MVNDSRESALPGLFARAFARCRGEEANARLEQIREDVAKEAGRAFSYEVLLRGTGLPGLPVASRGWGYLRDVVAPRLGYHVRGMKLRVLSAPGVFLTIFDGGDVFFVRGADFYAYYKEVEGLSDIELARRAAAWESEGGGEE